MVDVLLDIYPKLQVLDHYTAHPQAHRSMDVTFIQLSVSHSN